MTTQVSHQTLAGHLGRHATEILLPRLLILAAVLCMHGLGFIYVHEVEAAQVVDNAAALIQPVQTARSVRSSRPQQCLRAPAAVRPA